MSAAGELREAAPAHSYHETFEFHVDVGRQLVRVRSGDRVTRRKDPRRRQRNLCLHPDFKSTLAGILDLRDAREPRTSFGSPTSVQDHAARMRKIFRGQRGTAIFHSLEEAEDWIPS